MFEFTVDWYFLILLFAFLVRYFEDTLKDAHGRHANVHHEHQSALVSICQRASSSLTQQLVQATSKLTQYITVLLATPVASCCMT